MAELYHLHIKGIKEHKWKEKKEIIINNNFTNRLGDKINNFNDCTNNRNLEDIANYLNDILATIGYQTYSKMPLHLILDHMLNNQSKIDKKTQMIILNELKTLAFHSSVFKRELAMENFRKDNNSSLPSRLHCLYATTENGIEFWKKRIIDDDIDIYRIEVLEEPFKTSEIFIPDESFNYQELYKNSYGYWNPKLKNIPEETSEYLVKGKVKILEKVDEIKKQ